MRQFKPPSMTSRVFGMVGKLLAPAWRIAESNYAREGNTWYMSRLDELDIELLRVVAKAVQPFRPHLGTCAHCHMPWGLVKEYLIELDESTGCFVVCVACWDRLSRYGERDVFTNYMRDAYVRYWPDRPWDQYERAIAKVWKR